MCGQSVKKWRLAGSILIVVNFWLLRSQHTSEKKPIFFLTYSRASAVMSPPYDRSPTGWFSLRRPPGAIVACPRNETPPATLWGPGSQEICGDDGQLATMMRGRMTTIGWWDGYIKYITIACKFNAYKYIYDLTSLTMIMCLEELKIRC
jgi:hypothetical protein